MKRFEFAHVAEGIARQAGALLGSSIPREWNGVQGRCGPGDGGRPSEREASFARS